MKKIILFAATLFLAFTATNAQSVATTSANKTGTTKVNVILKPIQTLLVNPAHEKVDLVYESVKDYKKGVSSTKKNHLTIYSTGAFIVQVNSASDIMKSSGEKHEINASTIMVKASLGSKNALENATLGDVSLSSSATNLISSGTGGVDRNFDVTYTGLGGDAYVNRFHNDEGGFSTVYIADVTYTIMAQ